MSLDAINKKGNNGNHDACYTICNYCLYIPVLCSKGNQPEAPRVQVNPSYVDVAEGQPIEIHCQSSGTPEPELVFRRLDGYPLNPTVSSKVFRLFEF